MPTTPAYRRFLQANLLCLIAWNIVGNEGADTAGFARPDAFDTSAARGRARLVQRYPLQPIIADVAELGTDMGNGTAAPRPIRHPNVYSGLALGHSETGLLTFIGIADRGPTHHCGDGVLDKGFRWPHFSPGVFKLHINLTSAHVQIADECTFSKPLVPHKAAPKWSGGAGPEPSWDANGVTGLPNTENDERPFDETCAPMLRNPNGLDSEDVQMIPNTTLCVGVDEYSPSVFVFDCNFGTPKCGTMMVRYVPTGISPVMDAAAYPVHRILPEALQRRRINRGFESLAVSPDGKTAIAVLQSGMGDRYGAQHSSHSLMTVILDLTNPLNATLKGTYVLLAKDHHTFVGDRNGSWTGPGAIKASAAVWAGHWMGRGLDPIALVLIRGAKQVLAVAADFMHATDVTELLKTDPLLFDSLGNHHQSELAMARMHVRPAELKVFFDSGDLSDPRRVQISGIPEGVQWSEKQEGMTILNDCTLAFGNDNDAKGSSEMWIIKLPVCLSSGMKQDHTAGVVAAMLLVVGAVVGAVLLVMRRASAAAEATKELDEALLGY